MSAEHRELVNKLVRRLADESGIEALGDVMEREGYCDENGDPVETEGFLEVYRKNVRVVLAELRAMGRLK